MEVTSKDRNNNTNDSNGNARIYDLLCDEYAKYTVKMKGVISNIPLSLFRLYIFDNFNNRFQKGMIFYHLDIKYLTF